MRVSLQTRSTRGRSASRELHQSPSARREALPLGATRRPASNGHSTSAPRDNRIRVPNRDHMPERDVSPGKALQQVCHLNASLEWKYRSNTFSIFKGSLSDNVSNLVNNESFVDDSPQQLKLLSYLAQRNCAVVTRVVDRLQYSQSWCVCTLAHRMQSCLCLLCALITNV